VDKPINLISDRGVPVGVTHSVSQQAAVCWAHMITTKSVNQGLGAADNYGSLGCWRFDEMRSRAIPPGRPEDRKSNLPKHTPCDATTAAQGLELSRRGRS
jgi:hypothetical protein